MVLANRRPAPPSGVRHVPGRVVGQWRVSLSSRTERLLLVAMVVGVVVAAVIVILPSFWAPIGYDEGYNLQIVGNLLHGHGYATDAIYPSGPPQEFNYRITSGPTLMLPITATAYLLGTHVWVYRVIPVLFYVALLGSWWVIGRRTFGAGAGVAAVAGVLMIDGISVAATAPGSALGESAATACLLLAFLALERPGWCGLLVGLALMAKVLVLLAVPGVVVALLLQARHSGARRTSVLFLSTVTMALPVVAWQVVRIASLGWSGNLHADGDFLTFMREQGAGHVTVAEHVGSQIVTLDLAGLLVVVLSLLTIAVALATRSSARALLGRLGPELIGIGICGATFELWWLLSEAQAWPRHSLQATDLLLPLLLVLVVGAVPHIAMPPLRRVLAVAVGGVVVAQILVIAMSMWSPGRPTLAQQRQVAAQVGDRTTAYDYVRLDSPELRLLNPSLRSRPLGTGHGLLVFSDRGPSPLASCHRIVERYAGYVLCWATPAG